MLYLKGALYTFGGFCFIPYMSLGIYYSYWLGNQALGSWIGFIVSGLFISIGVIPPIIWAILKLKKALEI